MTYKKIQQEVIGMLSSPASNDVIMRRRNCVADLVRARETWDKVRRESRGFRLRDRGLALTITQRYASNAGRRLTVNAELLGNAVGTITLAPGENPIFKPKYLHRNHAGWQWSHSRDDGKEIRDYILRVEREIRERKGIQPERTIQFQLFKSLREKSRSKVSQLSDYRPMDYAGCMMEFPAGVAASAGLRRGAGTADLIVRHRRKTVFLVFEIKKPGETGVFNALRQAIRYATALDVLANTGDATVRTQYRRVFGAGGNKELRFGAVAVLEDSEKTRHQAQVAFEALEVPQGELVSLLLYRAPSLNLSDDGFSWLSAK